MKPLETIPERLMTVILDAQVFIPSKRVRSYVTDIHW